MRCTITSILLFLTWISGLCQNINPDAGYIYDDSIVPKIEIFMEQDSLDELLDWDNWDNNHEYPATMIYSKSTVIDTISNVGFRLRGNTSRNAAKKSFKIAINSFIKGQNYYGLEKINLNGEHNDPTIMRSKICFDIFNDLGIPSSRSVHTRLFINGEYKGLYIHVEHIDEEFLQLRFDDASGNLYKCLYPADFIYKGDDPLLYAELNPWGNQRYALKTNLDEYDYSDLAHFIDVLNNYSGEEFKCEIERIFDVDAYLKVIAVDVLTANWDGPIVNKNNCYLYHDPTEDRFVYIPYDLDNTLGVDFFNVNWAQSDIYNWSDISNEYRPLYKKFMNDVEYRSRFSFYLEGLLNEYFEPVELAAKIGSLRSLIAQYRANDSYASDDYGWSYDDFINSFDGSLGGHVKVGLREYITERYSSATDQLQIIDLMPFVKYENIIWGSNEILFEVQAFDDNQVAEVKLYLSKNGEPWDSVPISLDTDWKGKYVYNVNQSGQLEYYFEVTDDGGQSSYFPRCQDGFLYLGYQPVPGIVINEFLASNTNDLIDDYGENEDWIELYNISDETIDLSNLYLSDDVSNPNKWSLPNVGLAPGEFEIIWADSDNGQGSLHTNFKLSKEGEFLGLFDSKENNYAPIDTFTFPSQDENKSYARLPNGVGDFTQSNYNTPGTNNDEVLGIEESSFFLEVYPNPVSGILHIESNVKFESIHIYNIHGVGILTSKSNNQIDVSSFLSGVYFLKFWNGQENQFIKFIKM